MSANREKKNCGTVLQYKKTHYTDCNPTLVTKYTQREKDFKEIFQNINMLRILDNYKFFFSTEKNQDFKKET